MFQTVPRKVLKPFRWWNSPYNHCKKIEALSIKLKFCTTDRKFKVAFLTWEANLTDFFLFARLNLPNVLISVAKKFFDSNFPSPCFDVPKASNFTSGGVQNCDTKNRRLGTIIIIIIHVSAMLYFSSSWTRPEITLKVHMKWKIISAYLKGLSKYRRMAFFIFKYLSSFQRY